MVYHTPLPSEAKFTNPSKNETSQGSFVITTQKLNTLLAVFQETLPPNEATSQKQKHPRGVSGNEPINKTMPQWKTPGK